MKISYNWLKWYVPDAPKPKELENVLTYHLCEVEGVETLPDGDVIFDVNILPNRAHDLLSHQGMAREISGLLGIPYKDPSSLYKVPESKNTNLDIRIETDTCRRYMGRIVKGVKVGPSPEWVVKHLESIGQRSINNIVDATNIVMYDCGQPCHAFDSQKISGAISIRKAKEGETMTTLDGKEVSLRTSDMVIADDEGVLAIAGVKGGTKAEVDENTTDVVLEVANFDPVSVRKTARFFGILTDSAKRFENDLSKEHASYGMLELSGLFVEIAPEASFETIVDIYPHPQKKREISFSLSYIEKRLGMSVGVETIERMLTKYLIPYKTTKSVFTIEVPALRLDLEGPHDIAEEVGRFLGYGTLIPVMPTVSFSPRESVERTRIVSARNQLLTQGYSEVMTYTFGKKGEIQVARGPKGKDMLRTNLSDGLKEAYELNRLHAPLLGPFETKIFEIGTVFPEKGKEEIHVAYADKKGVVEATLEEFSRDSNGQVFERQMSSGNLFVPWSLYPYIIRDIAVWVPEGTNPQDLISLYEEKGGILLACSPYVFDMFTKDGQTSIAIRLVFQSKDRTLTDSEVEPIVQSIYISLSEKGWEIR